MEECHGGDKGCDDLQIMWTLWNPICVTKKLMFVMVQTSSLATSLPTTRGTQKVNQFRIHGTGS